MQSFIKNWTQREFDNLARSFQRAKIFFCALKFSLPVIILLMVAGLVFMADEDKKVTKISLADGLKQAKNDAKEIIGHNFSAQDISATGVMESPKFQGIDGSNQAYSVAAERGWQQSTNEVRLEKIVADISLKDGKWVSILAGEGDYFLAEKQVNLRSSVEIFMTSEDGQNFNIKAENLQLDIANSIASSSGKITVRSDMGNFDATGFIADRTSEKIIFQGPIKLLLLQK